MNLVKIWLFSTFVRVTTVSYYHKREDSISWRERLCHGLQMFRTDSICCFRFGPVTPQYFVLLALPIAHMPGTYVSYIYVLFTSTSGTTVTGLIAIETYILMLLVVVIALLIQIGGLGVTSEVLFLS